MVNFYRRFLPGIARMLQPLTDTLRGVPKTLEWLPTGAPSPERHALPLPLHATDPSDTHVGGVLQQLNGGSWQPLVFYSKRLTEAGTRYSTVDRELLAAFSAVRHFRFLLEGRQFRLLPGRRRRLARPPPLGNAEHQGLLQGRQQIFPGRDGIRFTADSTRPVRQYHRVAIAVLPQRPANHDDRPPATANTTQLSSSSIYTTRGAAAGPPGRCAATVVADLRRPLPSAGAVNTLLPPRDGG
jgi:hypothetical protein